MGRDRFARQSLGSLYEHIKQARVLMVGAGGIGCELVKNLVLTGFGDIHVVDLDTIDLSNLNRQFLFRHEHIKMPKSIVARESVLKFNPTVHIEAYHANIKDTRFNIDWFRSFNLVFNALDNLDARRHVNRMCLAADVPLIESGTTGFNGQVQVIKKGQTECYDCNMKETPKSFPVCTIRSTPSQPIHCIVWAKSYLFTEVFGISEEDSPELDNSEDSENREEINKLRQEAKALKRIRESLGSSEFPRMVFNKVFKEDVYRLRGMEDMWKSREAPEPLDYDTISGLTTKIEPTISHNDQVVWSLEENFFVFCNSIQRLSSRLEALKSNHSGDTPVLSFDKDDEDALDFVASSANLRSQIFGIDTRSKFDIKQMAGNIIPAIATTNAMTAGLCVLQAFKVMRNSLDKARMIFLAKSTERVITSEPLRLPNPDCAVCSVTQSRLIVDTSRATLNDLVHDLLRLELGYGDEFSVNNNLGPIYDPDLEDNLAKSFNDLGIVDTSFLTVIDEDDVEPRVNLVFSVANKSIPETSKPIALPEKLDIARKPKQRSQPFPLQLGNGTNDTNGGRKRRASEASFDTEPIKKRGRLDISHPQNPDDVIVLDDTEGGTIVIDD
ncbi:putative ubiquitin-like activating enzyme [Lineolata rhizophorae]|uniref:Putative ubiquitin-like activating enzyme n=1 Tax=Lineolata rhizophorae TaxID=578093 RepID=A0A6A6PAW5_9PEZI|nr:putative ubiquitin-like activating enzyme [Lineolata rhizophorae]